MRAPAENDIMFLRRRWYLCALETKILCRTTNPLHYTSRGMQPALLQEEQGQEHQRHQQPRAPKVKTEIRTLRFHYRWRVYPDAVSAPQCRWSTTATFGTNQPTPAA